MARWIDSLPTKLFDIRIDWNWFSVQMYCVIPCQYTIACIKWMLLRGGVLKSKFHPWKESGKIFSWLLAGNKKVYLKPWQFSNESKSKEECKIQIKQTRSISYWTSYVMAQRKTSSHDKMTRYQYRTPYRLKSLTIDSKMEFPSEEVSRTRSGIPTLSTLTTPPPTRYLVQPPMG